MLPLVPSLALSFFSFFASIFVILRIVIPVLPPHPLSRRVRPSEFGLPDFRSLSAADKSHVWLAACDLVALVLFIWEALMQYYGSPAGFASASNVGSSVRLWLALSLRPTCLLVVSGLTLLHVRLGKPVAFGARHWMLWAPTLVLVAFSTAIAGVISSIRVTTFFYGTIGYTSALAIGSTVAFAGLIGTLMSIKRNLQAIDDTDSWPPARNEEKQPRPSFATDDVDVLRVRDNTSWISSRADSDRESISAFSFSTHNTHVQHPAIASNPSIPPKSSYWFNPSTAHLNGNAHDSVPPVPPLPSPYRTRVCGDDHPDPFRRAETPLEHHVARMHKSSQSSWFTSSSGTRPTAVSAWSFPTSRPGSPELDAAVASTQDLNSHLIQTRPNTPALSSAQVLGGYGYVSPSPDVEKGVTKLATESSIDIDVSFFRIATWLAGIWVPLGLSLPYLATLNATHLNADMVASILFILSITLSSPLLALSILMRHGVPIPTGLFDARKEPPSIVHRAPSPADTLTAPGIFSKEYKRSGSMTVVEGRRSTDVWLAKGEAVDGKGRVGRALGMLAPAPKLSVLPPEDADDAAEFAQIPLTPPLPIQEPVESVPPTPQSSNAAELGHSSSSASAPRARTKSTTSSAHLSADENLAFTSRIMVAQRHYSHMALTMVLPPSPDRLVQAADGSEPVTPIEPAVTLATGVAIATTTPPTHLRTRSATSWSPPPQFPASPGQGSPISTPPVRYRAARHRKSHSAVSVAGYDFGTVPRDDAAEIDKLSAGLLPLLVPGLKVGSDVRVSTSDVIPSPPLSSGAAPTSTTSKRSRMSTALEFGGHTFDEFSGSGPQAHSTPYRRARKTSAHKRNHLSLPSLALGKDGAHSLAKWLKETGTALDAKVEEYRADNRRKTIALMPATARPASSLASRPVSYMPSVYPESVTRPSSYARSAAPTPPPSSRLPDVPIRRTPRSSHQVNPDDRNSLALLIAALEQPVAPLPPPSAASDVTLFDLAGVAPLAESTPPDYRRRSAGRSSITYIRSDDNPEPAQQQPRRIFGRLRPLVGKHLPSITPSPPDTQDRDHAALPPVPAAGGLRPLSLLQDRPAASAVRGLSIKKSSKSKRAATAGSAGKENTADAENTPYAGKENAGSGKTSGTSSGKKHKRLRSLKITRSDTTKERAALRAAEVVPNVVVRPPSDAFAFSGFR